ncbi:MAG: carbon monoxide dehydrogenase subunit G [Hyphomicrobiales bacterium]|nr:carbon monoxide dehydrogenase subunit G [Hyphomicrobiales bacterium]
MELNGQQTIKASRDAVYEALNNVDVLKQCVPGCESLEKTSDTEMSAVVALKIGPVKAKFNGAVTLTNLNAPESYTIVGEGSGGAAGFAKGSADVTLSEQGDETLLDYQVKADVGGKLAQLGNRLIDSTAKKLSNEFFVKFGEIVEAGPEAWTEDEAEEAKEAAPAPAAAEGGIPRWVWIAAATAAALIAVYALS